MFALEPSNIPLQVALGNSDARTAANAEPPQGGCHSILGLGNQVPSVVSRLAPSLKLSNLPQSRAYKQPT
jgi:hypothetical protein